MEGSRSMKFTHNVDWDMIKSIGEGKFIQFIMAIFKKENILNLFNPFLIAIIK